MKYLITSILAATCLLSSASAQLIEPPASTPTPAQQVAQDLAALVNQEITRRVMVHQIAFAKIWRNENATAAESLAALGNKAALIFGFASENLDHIDRCAKMVGKTRADFIPDADCVPPLAFTVHADGTVTIAP